jgi:pimeloyl-ACP methyl ester carboxylesterase
MHSVTIGSLRCSYRMQQNLPSPALILLHGSGGDSSVWDEQFKGMSFNGTLIAPDLPGHGQSAGFPLQSSSDYALWLDSLVNELQPENLFIAGHSLGGAIAQEFARDRKSVV